MSGGDFLSKRLEDEKFHDYNEPTHLRNVNICETV